MARMARAVAVGMAHHITQRGNYRQTVFFDAGDRQLYLAIFAGKRLALPPSTSWVHNGVQSRPPDRGAGA